VRSFLVFALVGSLVWLVGCGGGTPVGVTPITVSLTPSSAQTINQGATLGIVATVANDPTGSGVSWNLSGVGSLNTQTETTSSVTYDAPSSVTSNTTVTVTATSIADTSATASLQITVQASSVTVSLTPSKPQIVSQGGTVSITASVKGDTTGVNWSISPASGDGTLKSETATTVTYDAPASVTSNAVVTITATSKKNTSSTAQLVINLVAPGQSNVQPIAVDGGPLTNYPDGAFTSVTICVPGTSQCQTIEGILVDTGSVGLRILASEINLPLQPLAAASGGTLNNCVSFVDGSFLWGEVEPADVYMAGEVSSELPVHVLADPTTFTIPTTCSMGGTDEDNQTALGANGIIGVGMEPTDCTIQGQNFCNVPSNQNIYYGCTSSGCEITTVPIADQVTNPVDLFAANSVTSGEDNNGVILQFPSLSGAAATLDGSMIFGIGTESNNALGGATVYTVDPSDDDFTTENFEGQTMPSSFIDSGSNGFFFPSSFIVCPDNADFYCDAQNASATNVGANNAQGIVDFTIANADDLFKTGDFAYGDLGGPNGTYPCNGTGCSFDWGLPFFFGRSVYTSIDGQTVPSGQPAAPWWAY